MSALTTKPATRILVDRERRAVPAGELDFKRVQGGLLVQERDWDVEDRDTMNVAAGSLTEAQWGDALFAWRVCKHVWSNAIVLAKNLQTVGIGAGQQSRVDAVRIAIEKAQSFEHDLTGSALASDAFFPFSDGPELALARGVSVIVQPGGSKRDDEVIAAVQAAGASMVFTGRRHFRH
jgi:phosphoribosylaminoimidazolecarboxamide formyltransferase/IMP cyclohydrolase